MTLRWSAESLMWIGLLGLVLAGVSVWRWTRPVDAVRLAEYRRVPEFSLTERSGKTITRADLLGRVSIVDFFYTRCAETCPLQSACLARLQSEPLLYSNVLLVSITVDPDYDTPAVLTDYATRLHADRRRWLFLTGPRSAIYRLAVDGFGLAAFSSRRPEHVLSQTWLGLSAAWAHGGSASSQIIRLVHASRFAVVDRAGRIRDYVDATDPTAIDGLVRIVNQLLRERPEPADPSPS